MKKTNLDMWYHPWGRVNFHCVLIEPCLAVANIGFGRQSLSVFAANFRHSKENCSIRDYYLSLVKTPTGLSVLCAPRHAESSTLHGVRTSSVVANWSSQIPLVQLGIATGGMVTYPPPIQFFNASMG